MGSKGIKDTDGSKKDIKKWYWLFSYCLTGGKVW